MPHGTIPSFYCLLNPFLRNFFFFFFEFLTPYTYHKSVYIVHCFLCNTFSAWFYACNLQVRADQLADKHPISSAFPSVSLMMVKPLDHLSCTTLEDPSINYISALFKGISCKSDLVFDNWLNLNNYVPHNVHCIFSSLQKEGGRIQDRQWL